MPDFATLYDPSEYLYAHDLNGRDVTVTIEKIEAGIIVGDGGKKSRKPIASFVGATKRFAINKTNAKTLVAMTGSRNTDDWIGKSITLYATTTTMGGDTVPCIRIRAKAVQK